MQTRRIFFALPGIACGLLWIAVLVRRPAAAITFNVPAGDWLLPLLGLASLLAIAGLHRAHRAVFGLVDRILFLLAALPGALLLASWVVALTGTRTAPLLGNAGLGMLLMFPAVMLVGSALVRHRILHGWNQVAALGGFALPLGVLAIRVLGQPMTAVGFAGLIGLGWIVIGVAACSRKAE